MISIILPTFNRDFIISSTINCVLKQSFVKYELIIIDDCSTDNTAKIIHDYCNKDERIKYIKNRQNIGCAESREIGCQNSAGNFIVFLDDDDEWPPDKLMKQYNSLTHNNSDVVISDYYIKKNNELVYQNMKDFGINFKNEILKRPGPFFQSIMIQKKLLDKMDSPFDTASIPSEDWNFFIELSKLNPKVNYIDQPLFTWNMHSDNQSLNLKKEAEALVYILKKHAIYINKIHGKGILANHYRRIARLYEKKCDDKNTYKYIEKFYTKAFLTAPLSIKNLFYFIMTSIGYDRTRLIINWMRKLRGVPND